jgi:hypothetical protein
MSKIIQLDVHDKLFDPKLKLDFPKKKPTYLGLTYLST